MPPEGGRAGRAQRGDGVQLWDSRDPGEWSGRQRLRGARRAGRIPWSRHLCWREFRCGEGHGTAFRPDHELATIVERHGLDPGIEQIVDCQSGVRSTTVLFALARLGWDPTRLFNHDGSWRDWCREPGNPVLREVAGPTGGENAP